jgi:type I restriction-modification system DNA methylase subunit
MPKREVQDFISHWSAASASERANSQPFLLDLCDLLDVPRPDPNPTNGYFFEFPIVEQHPDGTISNGRIDLYRRAHFVLESKQFQEAKAKASQLELAAVEAGVIARKKSSQPVRGTGAWDDAMIKARGQAERYVRAIPDDNPPFIIVVDLGHSFELFADFTQAGKAYLPFPDPRTFRIRLADLANDKIRERLHLIWTNPTALDPAKRSADVTREVSGHLAELAKSLEQAGHQPEIVAQFLTRCLFCMFAEDVELLPKNSFTELLESLQANGEGFVQKIRTLFEEMQKGTDYSVVLNRKLLRFNGGLFENCSVLPITGLQLGLLKEAARQNWGNVEPAIFGTLLERALNPDERHQLGAHFTPRAYVERLVLPTVMEPLRAEWELVRAAALSHARADNLKQARDEVNSFHDRLCQLVVLDPACGVGNFLYVSLQHLKILEGEVLDFAAQFGDTFKLELATNTIDPHQFLGLEINPRAAAIAELVLWIGYLQWHFKLHGKRTPPEPILRAFKNIQCRDAVLKYDGKPQPARDQAGKEITVWDRRSHKTDMVTGREVPDETKRVPLLTYANPKPAEWPQADFIVGNPPFIGTARMREDLGDGYAETLRATYPDVPESADFVLYWWHKAAELVRAGRAKRFGLITTNSLRQTFARRVVQAQLSAQPPLSLLFAIPDHPWVDTAGGAAVRIAMTVGAAGERPGELLEVTGEEPQPDGSEKVSFKSQLGKISAELTTGANVAATVALNSNLGLSSMGVKLHGMGFVLSLEEVSKTPKNPSIIKHYLCGRDLVQERRPQFVIDLFGFSEEQVRRSFPEVYQHVLTHVKPEKLFKRAGKLPLQLLPTFHAWSASRKLRRSG